MTHDPTHPERDRELGDALRAALAGHTSNEAFVASVLARYPAPRLYVRDALASWCRWGVAAAAVIVIAGLLTARSSRDASASLDDALTDMGNETTASLMTDETAPGVDIIFTPAGEPR